MNEFNILMRCQIFYNPLLTSNTLSGQIFSDRLAKITANQFILHKAIKQNTALTVDKLAPLG